jgi:tripartite ATP-independent transporter DctM subunit
MARQTFTLRERLESLPKIIPFLIIIAGVLSALYGGVATPSEAAGVGALLTLLVALIIYRIWQPRRIYAIMNDSMRESVMVLLIIGVSELFSYMLSRLFVTQAIAEWIAALEVNRWVLMLLVNLFLLVAGCFLPPVAIILMSAPILVPIIEQAGFDPYWFAAVVTINMELGLVTPPVGLNLFVINGITPDVKLPTILWGTLPFMLAMVLGIVIISIFPGIATWLPDYLMGPAT